MKILHLSESDIAGAGRAAYRLHKGLEGIGITSQMLLQARSSSDEPTIISPKTSIDKGLGKLRPIVDNLPLHLYSNRVHSPFSVQWLPDRLTDQVAQLDPDVIVLHWICHGYVPIETVARLNKLNKPLVWTLHDMWPFTGGCHYTQNCDRYQTSCGTCPQLGSHQNWDLSRWIWQRKAKAWKNMNLTLVASSTWLAECASSSSLFKDVRVEVIPIGLNPDHYKPTDRQVARKILNFTQDKQLILFGSMYKTSDKRKGFHLLQLALQKLANSEWREKIELVVFGSSQPENQVDLGFKSHYLGRLHDDVTLALVYSAADVMIVPSTQEAFGQTASESLACGTPVVAFNTTGLKDIVDHQQNGYLASAFEVEDLVQGIIWVLENKERHQKLGECARQKAEEEFSLERQALCYQSLFTELIDSTPKT